MTAIKPGPHIGPGADFFKIKITHVATGQKVAFDGWVTQFSDDYQSSWNEQAVYGRMDPLSTFQQTRRSIQLGFDIPNASSQEATENMKRIQKFIKFLYPVYDASQTQRTLTAAPLLQLRWTNLISSPETDGQKLVGYINGGVSYAPDLGDGGFLRPGVISYGAETDEGNILGIKNYFPKKVSLSFTFTVLHTHLVGWTQEEAAGPQEDASAGETAEEGDGSDAPSATPTTTTSFVFGGKSLIDSRYPNLYTDPPIPANIQASRAEFAARRPGEEVIERDDEAADAATLAALTEEANSLEEEERQREAERSRQLAQEQAAGLASAQAQLTGYYNPGNDNSLYTDREGEGDEGLSTAALIAKYGGGR